MRNVPPSTLVREEIEQLFQGGIDPGTNVLSALAELGVRYLAQQALEQQQADHLGRDRYERGEPERGYRNGYEPKRVRTAEGEVRLAVPRSEEPRLRTGPHSSSSSPATPRCWSAW